MQLSSLCMWVMILALRSESDVGVFEIVVGGVLGVGCSIDTSAFVLEVLQRGSEVSTSVVRLAIPVIVSVVRRLLVDDSIASSRQAKVMQDV